MNRDEMMDTFRELAQSQGLYGRLLQQIQEMTPNEREEFWTTLEGENFQDTVSLVMFIEGEM